MMEEIAEIEAAISLPKNLLDIVYFRSVIWAANLSVLLGSDAGVGTLRCFAEMRIS
jgi:hypothetical protein